MLTKIGTLLVAFFNDNIPVALAINFGTQPLKAAVVAVAIWLSFINKSEQRLLGIDQLNYEYSSEFSHFCNFYLI